MVDLNSSYPLDGTDDIAPILPSDSQFNPAELFRIWELSQLWQGQAGAQANKGKRYVGKVGDLVFDGKLNKFYKIIKVGEFPYIPVLEELGKGIFDNSLSEEQKYIATNFSNPDTYKTYINDEVIPYEVRVDPRLPIPGTFVKYAILYRGSASDDTLEVISGRYTVDGRLTDTHINLELREAKTINGFTNHTVKTAMPTHTMRKIKNGEMLTLMAYDDNDNICFIQPTMALLTNFFFGTEDSQKHIVGISLKSDFLDTSDPSMLKFPANVNIVGINLFGIIHYNNGTKLEIPVDGTRFSITGMDDLLITQVGHEFKPQLVYMLGEDEHAYGPNIGINNTIVLDLKAQVGPREGAYSVKLFGYPVYLNPTLGYRMEWFMLDLTRQRFHKVTPYVTYSNFGGAAKFQGNLWGVNQFITVSLNLSSVDPTYKSFTFAQTMYVEVIEPSNSHSKDPWLVQYETSQSPRYGTGVKAFMLPKEQDFKEFNLSCGEGNIQDWLSRLYYGTRPLYNPEVEVKAPKPNMFAIMLPQGGQAEYPISQWNTTLTASGLFADGDTLFIKFFNRSPTGDSNLAVAGLNIQTVTNW